MARNKTMMTTLALGAAYLLRNEKSRTKIMNQFKGLGMSSKSKNAEQKSLPLA
ncbi:hypothetical protein NLX67_16350 [Domibacillus sp. A3M-37]|uniref:hypothetical protein n=1 Tax=Domibacillus TaxID=1433999 RepID=UPI0020B75D84|nr:hypothetical protein [Domibacillus sp. A3M-37]MCP3763940.1 hypothetical protein [Domibacillus sp. A3M-37]